MLELYDTHCHLNTSQFENDLDKVINDAKENGVSKIIVPGTDISSSEKAIELSENYPQIFAAVGIHPNDGNSWDNNSIYKLESLLKHPKVVAVGEIGLDYHWKTCPDEIQKKIFTDQLDLARKFDLPVILHSRESLADLISIIFDWTKNKFVENQYIPRGVFHSFEGDLSAANKVIELNFLIGIGGPVTYKNAMTKQNLAKNLPISSILLETDSPYLSPHPYRGQRNNPSNILNIAEKISQIRETQIKLVAQETTNNANKLFAWEY